jgi:hypothetical protein
MTMTQNTNEPQRQRRLSTAVTAQRGHDDEGVFRPKQCFIVVWVDCPQAGPEDHGLRSDPDRPYRSGVRAKYLADRPPIGGSDPIYNKSTRVQKHKIK